MGSYKEIPGDLIKLAKQGKFDVITHGCNCFCTMGAGIAPLMARAFFADTFEKEGKAFKGDINKLGTIDYKTLFVDEHGDVYAHEEVSSDMALTVVNSYTQYGFASNTKGSQIPLDYMALIMCCKKINHEFKGKKIGLPQIGCGLAGGDWDRVRFIIKRYLQDCDVSVVIYNG